MARSSTKDSDLPLFSFETRKFLTISELNDLIKGTLEARLDGLWVQGEISNFRVPPSGHCYFTLKDDRSQISAVMFRRQGAALRFTPENGLAVLCLGRVSVYTVRGDLQLYVEEMEPQGQGALFLAFEQLKKKLAAQGLFADSRKRTLPFLPDTIGIVTSSKGAALHDMLRILRDRFSDRRIIIRAVKVQGDGAAREIAEAIADFNRLGGVDVLIVGRGGGSLEDLWAFNEEVVAKAICAFKYSNRFGGGARDRFHHRRFRRGLPRSHSNRCGRNDHAAKSRFARASQSTGDPTAAMHGRQIGPAKTNLPRLGQTPCRSSS